MILLLGLWTFVRAMTLGSAAIALENVALRHQLAVLQRSVRRPQFHRWDRAFWVGLSQWWRNWRTSLVIVQPATVISWHRQGFQLYELSEVLAGRSARWDDVPRLRYTQMIIKESLRLFPPVWGIGRETLREIQFDDYRLPAGTNVFISQWVTQRDPRFFDRPHDFLPERWNDEFEKRLPKFAYFPFGGGPRVCIGASLASMEAALLLATIAQRFRLTLAAGHPVNPYASAALRPRHGIRVTLRKR